MLFLMILLILGQLALGQDQENDPLARTMPSSEIPDPIDKYSYRVTGTNAGVEFHTTEVPLWNFEGGRFQVGSLAIGSPLKLDFVRGIGGRNFFGFKQQVRRGEADVEQIVWIDGRFVEISGQN